ncbi:uncharacterized protein isoform X1 [Choristoneura fumiferana]|uniref:uncharacterized protein isoform X1 n=1 Tax=Choristoneura fumiferana TaxID=7141 RepID=UPI003D15AF82
MFYPEASLKKGGRFYLCWVADSWPLCFATITHRQLWAQDIRKICDDLLEVMNNESGRPGSRFSLRLSSQLMRGLVRLYQRKVVIMLGDLCMINARVMKSSNKKLNIHEPIEDIERQLFPMLELPAIVPELPAEPEERVEELIQQSGNVVSNIQDITLKEAAIPDFQLPPNDGFGEENPNQAIQLLQDRTLEQMLGASTSALHSGLELPLAESSAADKTHESRLAVEPQMERISEHDVTLFHKSIPQDILPEEPEKDIPIPEIPPLDLPLPAPTEKEPQEPDLEVIPVVEPPVETAPVLEARIDPAVQAPVEVEIEELEELEPQAKRRRKNKLIIDKKTIIPSSFFRPRLENIAVELRCEDSSEDIADLRVPWDILSHRPAAAGARVRSTLARPLAALFLRNLGVAGSTAQREMELALAAHARTQPPTVLEIIPEEEPQEAGPQQIPEPQPEQQIPEPEQPNILDQSIVVPDLRVSAIGEDIADLPTQKLERTSQKRTTPREEHEVPAEETAKRPRLSGFVSFRQQQHQFHTSEKEEQQIVEKENIPDNRQLVPPQLDEQPPIPEVFIHPSSPEKRLTTLLQEAGLADMEMRPEVQMEEESQRKSRKHGSESSETMLGSLDRTKVSLGDSEHTTDSKRFIRDQWGTEGTMVKILRAIKVEIRPLDVGALISCGPLLPGCKRVIAARCFSSILKLKHHGFIKVSKNPETLEVRDIVLGPKFDIN